MYLSIAVTIILGAIGIFAYFARRRPVVTEIEDDPIAADINNQLRLGGPVPSEEIRHRQLEKIARGPHEEVATV